MYFMHTFDDLIGKEISATRGCLFSSASGKTIYRALFHLTQDHGVLLFSVDATDTDDGPKGSNVLATNMDILLCAMESSFQDTMLRLGVSAEEMRNCVIDIIASNEKKHPGLTRKLISCLRGKG